MDRKALVTGATGCLGGHLSRTLLERGWPVRAMVRDTEKARPSADLGMEIAVADVRDAEAVDRAVAGCTHVFHAAGLYREARHDVDLFRQVNVEGTRHLLDAARAHGVERFAHGSTIGVHGHIARVPANEETPFDPHDPYQHSKLAGEKLAWTAIERGDPVTIFRPCSIYGPGDLRFLKLFKGIKTGRFVMFGPGTNTYHMTYLDDLCAGIIRCAEEPAAIGQAFILPGDRYVTINELVEMIARAVSASPPRLRLPLPLLTAGTATLETVCKPLGIEPPVHRRSADFFTASRGFDGSKAKRILGWEPRVALPEGLARTAAWYREQALLPA